MKTPQFVALLTLPLFLLSACLDEGLDIGKLELDPAQLFAGEPQYVLAEEENVPPEAPALLSALFLRLQGKSAGSIEKQLAVSGSALVQPESTFLYEGFAIRRILIDQIGPDEGKPDRRHLTGRLYLEDPLGRATSVAFDLGYGLRGEKLQIRKAKWNPAVSEAPRTALFVVPRKAIERDLKKASASYRSLYDLVIERAIEVNPPAILPRSPKDYLLFVFFKDRLAPKAEMQLFVGKAPEQDGGYGGASSMIAYPDGWAVGLIAGRFALSRQDPFWVKVYYRAETKNQLDVLGLDLDLLGLQRIGLFPVPPSNQPSS